MRFVLLVVLLQACVSSSIQLDPDTGDERPVADAGPNDAALDAAVDAPAPLDAPHDTPSDAGPCPMIALPASSLCYDITCALVEPYIDEECIIVCDPAPVGCLTECNMEEEEEEVCFVDYECCGPECSVVARNQEGHDDYLDSCVEEQPSLTLAASCVSGVCEIDLSGCVPGAGQCVELLDPSGEDCGGNFALNEEAVDTYVETICPAGDEMLPECCKTFGSRRAAICGSHSSCVGP